MINSVEIDYLAVGEGGRSGDAIALRFGNYDEGIWKSQTVFVIDGGGVDNGESLVNHIKDVYKTDYIELVILTHPDADHASGLRKVLEELKVGRILMHRPWNHWQDVKDSITDGRITKKSFGKTLKEAYQFAYELEQLALEKKIEIVAPKQGLYYHENNPEEPILKLLGPSKELYLNLIRASEKTPAMTMQESTSKIKETVKIEVLEDMTFETENLAEENGETSAENDMSLVIYLNVAGYKVLFTGDSGTMGMYNAIRYAVANDIDLKNLNLLHVPHHGSRRNISKGILKSLSAKASIISCALKGEPHHPSSIVTNALIRRDIIPFCTKGRKLTWHYGKVTLRDGLIPVAPITFAHYVQIEKK